MASPRRRALISARVAARQGYREAQIRVHHAGTAFVAAYHAECGRLTRPLLAILDPLVAIAPASGAASLQSLTSARNMLVLAFRFRAIGFDAANRIVALAPAQQLPPPRGRCWRCWPTAPPPSPSSRG